MTHQDAVNGAPALNPTFCPGELNVLGAYPDVIVEHGRTIERMVKLCLCQACGWMVPTVEGVALNHYKPAASREMVESLANRLSDGADRRDGE